MTTAPTPHTIVVFFNNGVNANRPWWVAIKEGRAITETLDQFAQAASAIVYAKLCCRKHHLPLQVPPWLSGLAAALRLDDAPADPHGFDGFLAEIRCGKAHLAQIDDATHEAIEAEWVGDDFCRQPFLY